MNKRELIKAVAERTATSQKDAEVMVNEVISVIAETLVAGDRVGLTGFGTFEVRDRAERQGHNPKTGEKLTIPACKSPAFKASPKLKSAVNA